MSRTDQTAPHFVKAQWVAKEHHDHRFGPCSLPAEPPRNESEILPPSERYKKCYWDYDWNDTLFRCGCQMCSIDTRRTNRKSRHEAKRDIQAGRFDRLSTSEGPARD